MGCSTNLVVLTHSQVTARGCAAFSVAAHLGVGLIVLGAVLLLGSFVLAVRQRRQAAGASATAVAPSPDEESRTEAGPVPATPPAAAATGEPPAPVAPVPTPPAPVQPSVEPPFVERRRVERRAPARVGPIPPGEDDRGPVGPVSLPPGWYGNPDNPGGPVQWWDGERLVDRPR
jgi:hypothetical protein